MKYLFLDPGHTTGYAVFNTGENMSFVSGQINTETSEDFIHLWDFMIDHSPYCIYYESFRLYAHKSQAQINNEFITCQVIGIIKLWAEMNKISINQTTPQKVKSIWTDQKLKKFGFHKPSQPHANDAMRHGLTILQVHRGESFRGRW
jgi:hypothetical protein